MIGTLSNGNVKLLDDLSKHVNLHWDVILSGEIFKRHKPNPEVYLQAAELLNLEPSEIMLAASHKYDLKAAKGLGFRTAYIFRPLEFGEVAKGQQPKADEVDYVVCGIYDLSEVLIYYEQ